MKNPAPTTLTHEIVCTFQGRIDLTRKGRRSPGLVAASSDELVTHSRKPPPILFRSRYKAETCSGIVKSGEIVAGFGLTLWDLRESGSDCGVKGGVSGNAF
jgi:hypothetical protein